MNFANFLGSLARHLLTAAGGYLVARGIISADVAPGFINTGTQVALGVFTYAIGHGWSIFKLTRHPS